MTDLRPIVTQVLEARVIVSTTLDELETVLDRMDAMLAGMQDDQARVYREALAVHPPVLPANVRPIRARAV